MDWWTSLDGFLISLYRLTGWPVLDYFTGTFLLAMITIIIGDFTTSLVFRANRGYYTRLNSRLGELHQLSMAALRLKEKSEYKAVNREANDTFGLLFFSMFGLSASYLWPAFFALAWMQTRFGDIRFPLFFEGWTTGYFFTFLVCYLLARILFSQLKPHLPYFKNVMDAEGSSVPGSLL
ncbi:MAG: hypothetical protein K6T65_11070 [Peptococcaceae bacterium]|nr:hypothetical protein [Peptococcaceae bacterium]